MRSDLFSHFFLTSIAIVRTPWQNLIYLIFMHPGFGFYESFIKSFSLKLLGHA